MSITLDGTAGISSTGGIDAADLTGALPALDGAALTALTSANLTGALPAISGSNLTGIDSPIKAWVNFNGTGVVAISASYNVSSITDNGTGDYTINFTTALTDANYSMSASGKVSAAGGVGYSAIGYAKLASPKTTTTCRINTSTLSTALFDYTEVNTQFFR